MCEHCQLERMVARAKKAEAEVARLTEEVQTRTSERDAEARQRAVLGNELAAERVQYDVSSSAQRLQDARAEITRLTLEVQRLEKVIADAAAAQDQATLEEIEMQRVMDDHPGFEVSKCDPGCCNDFWARHIQTGVEDCADTAEGAVRLVMLREKYRSRKTNQPTDP